MKTTKFLLRGIVYEVSYGLGGAEMRDDRGPLVYNVEEWIRTLSLGPCEIVGFNDLGVVVAWDPAGMGRRVVDWAEAYDMNRYGSIDGDIFAAAG